MREIWALPAMDELLQVPGPLGPLGLDGVPPPGSLGPDGVLGALGGLTGDGTEAGLGAEGGVAGLGAEAGLAEEARAWLSPTMLGAI